MLDGEGLSVMLLVQLLFALMIVSFLSTFVLQAVVILRLFRVSSVDPYFGVGNPNSFAANFYRFLKGELWPDLLRKWSLAWGCSLGLFLTIIIASLLLAD